MDTEGEIPGQEGGARVCVLPSQAAQVTNPTDGSIARGEVELWKQTIPVHLLGLVGAHPGEGYDEQEEHHEGVAAVIRMPVHWSRSL